MTAEAAEGVGGSRLATSADHIAASRRTGLRSALANLQRRASLARAADRASAPAISAGRGRCAGLANAVRVATAVPAAVVVAFCRSCRTAACAGIGEARRAGRRAVAALSPMAAAVRRFGSGETGPSGAAPRAVDWSAFGHAGGASAARTVARGADTRAVLADPSRRATRVRGDAWLTLAIRVAAAARTRDSRTGGRIDGCPRVQGRGGVGRCGHVERCIGERARTGVVFRSTHRAGVRRLAAVVGGVGGGTIADARLPAATDDKEVREASNDRETHGTGSSPAPIGRLSPHVLVPPIHCPARDL